MFREILPDLSDGDFTVLNHLLFDRLNFRSGIPPYTFKAKVANASLFRTFTITKNALIQSFQIAYLLAMILKDFRLPKAGYFYQGSLPSNVE